MLLIALRLRRMIARFTPDEASGRELPLEPDDFRSIRPEI
jgi:hypothetical protein